MRITAIEIVSSKEPIMLPEPWVAAWREPNGNGGKLPDGGISL